MTLYSFALILHIAAGTLALITYWTVGLMKKGTPRHRRFGQAYLLAMLGVIVSGLPLVQRAVQEGALVKAMFLGFLILLVSQACWSSWRAIRDRREPARFFGPVYWTLGGLTFLAGALMIGFGLQYGIAILAVFGGVGAFVGLGALRSRRRARTDPKWWLKEHYGAMIGNGVATHIAFFGVGLRNALPGVDPALLQNFAWFTPLAASLVAGWWLDRKYGGAPRKPAVPVATASPAS